MGWRLQRLVGAFGAFVAAPRHLCCTGARSWSAMTRPAARRAARAQHTPRRPRRDRNPAPGGGFTRRWFRPRYEMQETTETRSETALTLVRDGGGVGGTDPTLAAPAVERARASALASQAQNEQLWRRRRMEV